MPYNVNFTDPNLNPEPLEVFDNTSNVDTSLTFPGRNTTGYGKLIAENLLHLLENFASDQEPSSAKAVTGQLWFNSEESKLFVFDGIDWKTTSNIRTAVNEPQNSNIGDLWINTSTQQLYLWSGTDWILVGPQFSQGTKSGPLVESVFDIDNRERTIIVFYTNDIPVAIISREQFVPKISIQGFASINVGINLNTRTDLGDQSIIPKFIGTATSADALVVGTSIVPSTTFIRSDDIGTIQKQFNIRDNTGLTVGTDGNVNLRVSNANAELYNTISGASIDIQTSRNGLPNTILRVVEDRVGINNISPVESLDIIGNAKLTGNLISTSVDDSTNLENGAIRTLGGLSVAKNITVGGTVKLLNGTLITRSLEPISTTETIGRSDNKYNTIYASTVVADIIQGTLQGDIDGNSNSSTSLRSSTNFKLEGDVQSNVVSFNGTGNLNKTFTTQLTADIISNKPILANSRGTDEILIFRSNAGLRRISRDTFLDDSGVPIGSVFPWAGNGDDPTSVPPGYLLCDGSEVEVYRYRTLFDVLQNRFNGNLPLTNVPQASGTFRIPDLRGRFVLGYQLMDNSLFVPFPGGNPATTAVSPLRVTESQANVQGATGGSDQYVIEQFNLPDHDHDLRGRRADNQLSGVQFFVINDRSTTPTDFSPQTIIGGAGVPNIRRNYGTTANASQWMASSGLVRISNEAKRSPGFSDSLLGRPFPVMNPFLTMNYIIRSGKPIEQLPI